MSITVNFKRIGITEARALISEAPQNGLQIVDIRDEQSFQQAHIASASHLDNGNIQEFIASAAVDKPLLIYCYHGNMSQGAAAYFAEQGFTESYSLDGGFEAWQVE